LNTGLASGGGGGNGVGHPTRATQGDRATARVWEPALRTMVESSRVSRVSEGKMYSRFQSVAGSERVTGPAGSSPLEATRARAPRGVGESCVKGRYDSFLTPKGRCPSPPGSGLNTGIAAYQRGSKRGRSSTPWREVRLGHWAHQPRRGGNGVGDPNPTARLRSVGWAPARGGRWIGRPAHPCLRRRALWAVSEHGGHVSTRRSCRSSSSGPRGVGPPPGGRVT
jgi:hypothetical protein